MSQIASKTFATQCYFSDHLNQKTVNKATWRTPSANPHHIWAHLVEKLSSGCDYFMGFSGFTDLSGKVFLIFFKLSKLDCSIMFCMSNINNTVYFFEFR